MTMFRRRPTMDAQSVNEFAQGLFAPLPRRYDALAYLLSLGQDRRWRKAMVQRVLGVEPKLVLDVACGTGAVTKRLASRTHAHIVALDLSRAMLHQGRQVVERATLGQRVDLVRARAEQLPFADATFDAVTFTYLMRYVEDPAATIREIARVVRPGGAIASLEFAVPPEWWWRWAWRTYTRVILPLAGFVTGGRAWWFVGRFLGPSISRHYRRYPMAWTRDAWRRAGIEHVEVRRMSLGGGVVISGYRRAS